MDAAEFLRVSDEGLRSIQRETEADKTLQRLKEMVYKGERIIIPAALQKEVMSHIHASNQREQASRSGNHLPELLNHRYV